MRYVKITFWVLLAALVVAFFSYNLPKRDIVRITGTEVIRTDLSGANRFFYAEPDSGNSPQANRDLRLINTVFESGKVKVFRNEDTGLFGWPPYFKIDSSNMHAEAADLVSTRDAPVWVAITHYGWRSEFLSIYPNAIKFKVVEGPDVRLIPWMSIIILLLCVAFVFWLWRVWVQFKERKIDPLLDDANNTIEAVDQRADAAKDQARSWWARLTRRKP
ncbi:MULTISPECIES: DUF1523 family protein [Halocynthiibacter]|uniref:DUF1523 family protein n=1 Tax=Halocynthiibacter halioticoli TaxID=2986804 RepID=A0AAE3LQE1_9RHOB|nr:MULTISPECIES: DUF1523 family protein [Halocynthiibacter]MCV6823408.1 DUF1523 family protein [Halocynthiibacter halioticoli]MCW4056409.1 DUF1523 family protein [Halocynthiibacter sp. SDUM655004]MDE0590625.1 DUF1523 family protein [Halocynthiibacter sp. C4]